MRFPGCDERSKSELRGCITNKIDAFPAHLLRFVLAPLDVAEPPLHVDVVAVLLAPFEVRLVCVLVLATVDEAVVPLNIYVVDALLVALDVASLLGFEVADGPLLGPGLSAVVPADVDVVNELLVFLEVAGILRLVRAVILQ